MEATAKARFQRIAPRKARTVLNMIRGVNVAKAIDDLKYTPKAAATIVGKLLESAVANAREADENVDLDALVVKVAFADKAPNMHMRRWRPRAQGRATRIVKGMSHITVVIGDEKDS
ncbi:MAG: 50S ribosomal protein L22 [Myxococcota bacterium]